MPDDDEAAPPRPTGEWIKTWGSIATADNGDTGVSSGKIDKESADSAAIASCEGLDGSQCNVVFTFFNQCAAGAASDGGKGSIASAATIEAASDLARKRCEKLYGGTCRVTFSKCTDPVFKKF